jgi:hypothetical protein
MNPLRSSLPKSRDYWTTMQIRCTLHQLEWNWPTSICLVLKLHYSKSHESRAMKRLAFAMNISDVSVLQPSRVNEWIKRAAPQIHGFCAFIRLLDWWTSCLWNGQSNSIPFWKYRDHEMLGEEDVILQWRRINVEITAWNVNLIACSNEGAGKSIKLASLLYIWYLLRGYNDIKECKMTLIKFGNVSEIDESTKNGEILCFYICCEKTSCRQTTFWLTDAA